MARFITLLTDFGPEDIYVGVMKGVIGGLNAQATVVDLSHAVVPQNIFEGAFLLHIAHDYFPADTIHVAIVDPGVGSERRAIALRTSFGTFVGPDNGTLSYIIDRVAEPLTQKPSESKLHARELHPDAEAVVLAQPRFWRHPVSQTFHGRDIFAPVAAHLSLGVPLSLLGPSTRTLQAISLPQPEATEAGVEGRVVHIDRFGNLITNLRAEHLPEGSIVVAVSGVEIRSFVRYYDEGDDVMALIGSSGYVEVAVKNGSAEARLGMRRTDPIQVRRG
jgi:S-adenosylmethionine hydrolase